MSEGRGKLVDIIVAILLSSGPSLSEINTSMNNYFRVENGIWLLNFAVI